MTTRLTCASGYHEQRTDYRCDITELIAENVRLRHQLSILSRLIKRPQLTKGDWLAQLWREATLYGQAPRFVIRDNAEGIGTRPDGAGVWCGGDPHTISSATGECCLRATPVDCASGVTESSADLADLQRAAVAADCQRLRGVLQSSATAPRAPSADPKRQRRRCRYSGTVGQGHRVASAQRAALCITIIK